MTQYFCGKGGSDSNNGTTWALRKLNLSGASGLDTISVSGGDELIIGPGVYREDYGAAGVGTSKAIPIILRGDITGKDTDGVGGPVVMTGSDDDQTITRNIGIALTTTGRDFYKIQNIRFENFTNAYISVSNNGDGWVIEDCVFFITGSNPQGIVFGDVTDWEVRRCLFVGTRIGSGINASLSVEAACNAVIKDCLFIGLADGMNINRGIDVDIRNCTFLNQADDGLDSNTATTGTITVGNCLFFGADNAGIEAAEIGDIIEDYNNFWGNQFDRTLTDTGTNSTAYIPIFDLPMLLEGYKFPVPLYGELIDRDTLRIAGSSETASDLFGIAKPTTAAKSSWGAIQQRYVERETVTVYSSSVSSLKLDDAGETMFFVPVDGSEITISVRAHREADYAGTLPRMIIRQPGVADRVTTDVGSASQWNELNDTFTPSSDTDYVIVILRSLNTATSGSYVAFFDNLGVS